MSVHSSLQPRELLMALALMWLHIINCVIRSNENGSSTQSVQRLQTGIFKLRQGTKKSMGVGFIWSVIELTNLLMSRKSD